MIAYIDNILVQKPQDSLLYPTITLRNEDEEGKLAFGFSGDVTFIEEDYDYVYAKLKTDPNAQTNEIILKLVDDCCTPPREFEFKITSDDLDWCQGKCEVTCTPIEHSITNDQVICLKNKMIWDNYNGFKNQAHPRMIYCNELRPTWLQHTIMILLIQASTLLAVLLPILLMIATVVTIINAIINALNGLLPNNLQINTIQFDNDPTTNSFQEMQNIYTNLISFASGCGRKHPSPLVRGYANNVCGACGLSFSSTILNDANSPYWNTVYFNAPIDKGTLASDNSTYWIDKNKPLLSGTMFFDKLKPVYNAKWKVRNNTLYFERKDTFIPAAPFLDLTTLDQNDIKVCWRWENKEKYSYANLNYYKDAVNWVGAEAIDRWGDIIEWNNPYTPTQKGEYAPLIAFSACRFRDDGIDQDVLSYYQNFGPIGQSIQGADNAIIMNSHQCYEPMLLIWKESSGVQKAVVDNLSWYFPGYPDTSANQFYNYPYWFAEGYPGNLYTNFHYIDDPRISGYKGLEFTAEVPMTCALMQTIDIDGSVNTVEGISKKLQEITINKKSGTILIKGVV